MSTVGDFIVEKVRNMHAWLGKECEGYDSTTYGMQMDLLTPTAATIMAEILLQHKAIVYHRDWFNLRRIPNLPHEFVAIADLVQPQQQLHDKFWRYLELFVESVSSDT